MIEVRPFASLRCADHGWLRAVHHFSFNDYHDPDYMGWGGLRVCNDVTIAPGQGFPPHPYRNMEIITYVRKGALTYEDNLGNRGRTEAGDVHIMSAGTGILCRVYNREDVAAQIFQLWIEAPEHGGAPRWGTRAFPTGRRAGQLVTLASGYSEDRDALPLRTPARLVVAQLTAGQDYSYHLSTERRAYLVLASGAIEAGGATAAARDGVAVRDTEMLSFRALRDTELLMVDVSDCDGSGAAAPITQSLAAEV